MSMQQFGIRQGGMFVAKIDVGHDADAAKREAMHYLAVYAQDGEAELWHRSSSRHWRRTGIVMGAQDDA